MMQVMNATSLAPNDLSEALEPLLPSVRTYRSSGVGEWPMVARRPAKARAIAEDPLAEKERCHTP
jgi:hypothetical protein